MALKGVKVLEFAGLAPVPFCSMILTDFGAKVLRIDRLEDVALHHDFLGNGKQSLALDLKNPKSINIIKKLVKVSDVLLDPFRCGVMERLGLGPDILMKENPRLVYARLTGFGQHGPYSKRAGHDINYLGLSGLLSLFRRKDERPLPPVNFAADFAGGGLICALGITMALFERANSNQGQVIDSNMVEGAAYIGSWLFRSQSSPIWGKPIGQNLLDTGSYFYETYETKDGKFMSVGALEPKFFKELMTGLGLDMDQYGEDTDKGKSILKAKFMEKTRDEWCEIFDSRDACVFPILEVDETINFRHNQERQTFSKVDDMIVPKPAPLLDRTPGISKSREPLPKVGEHTEQILKDLGYMESEISELVSDGVIGINKESKL